MFTDILPLPDRLRLFCGARNPLEMLYMNDENSDLAYYFDQPTFKAFQAASPRPALDALERSAVLTAGMKPQPRLSG